MNPVMVASGLGFGFMPAWSTLNVSSEIDSKGGRWRKLTEDRFISSGRLLWRLAPPSSAAMRMLPAPAG